MKKPLFTVIALVLALGLALPMGTPTAVAQPIPPHLEVGKSVDPDPVSIDKEATVTLTITGAGDPIGERRSLDVILIIDRSASMAWDSPTRLSQAKVAAKAFIDILDPTRDQVGLVSFATSATLDIGLTDDFTSVKSAIDALSASGYTNIGDAIYTANDEFDDNGRTDALWVEILLTDGLPNKPNGTGWGFYEPDAAYARNAAQAAHDADITLYTIGLGAGISYYFLDDKPASEHNYNPGDPAGDGYLHPGLAYVGGGKFYYAPTGSDLQAIFEALAYELITIAGQNVVVTEVLPPGVHYVPGSINPPSPILPDGQTLIWNLGTISIGDTITLTFNVTFDSPGNQLVDVYPDSKVTYTDYLGGEKTEPFPETWVNVSAGAAASLDLTPDGGSATAGVAFDVTVTAKDSYGNVATGYTGTVHFTSTDSGSGVSLPTDYTFLPGDNGVKTFTSGVTLVTVGSQDVTVTDTVDDSLTDTEAWDVSARRRGGGGGGGVSITYFTVDFQGEITKEPMSSDGRLLNPLEAPSPDGMHLVEMAKGTKTVDDKGKIVKLIEIREAEAPFLAADTVIVGNAYDFEPSNITFDQPIMLTLGYDVNDLPEDIASIALAYYTTTTGWIELEPEGGVVAGVGKLTAPVDHFTIFAILAKLPPPPPPPLPSPPPAPAAFKVSNLQITPSQFRIWDPVTFVVKIGEEVAISAYVTNYGGQEGKYTAILKVNGATQATKEIILGSGQGQQIGFTLTENEPGRYTVDIGGLSGEFVTSLWTNWWLIGGILAALILIGWLTWYYRYYRRRY